MAGARNLNDGAPPTVSVVIPAYNRQDDIAAAIAGVRAQTFADYELIVVDDRSSDRTAEIVSAIDDPRLRLIRLDPNRGPAGARNAGAKAARGAWLAFLDSDDSWRPEKLERQLDFMRRRELSLSIVAFDIHRAGGGVNTVRLPETAVLRLPDLIRHPGLCIGTTMMIRRDLFEEVGGFDESLRRLEDWEWLIRLGRNQDIHALTEVLADHNAPARRGGAGEETADAVDAVLARHYRSLLDRDPQTARQFADMAVLHRANGYRLAGQWRAMIRALAGAAAVSPGRTIGHVWRRVFG